MHLKCSNGSRQFKHVNDALQAVDPNALTSFVSLVLQLGQGIVRSSPVRKALSWLWPTGGAIPCVVILTRVSSVIQSVVHAGLIAILTSALGSITRAANMQSSEITSVAGHPE